MNCVDVRSLLKSLHCVAFQLYEIPEPDFMHKTLAELNLGTFEDLATVNILFQLFFGRKLFIGF